MCIGPHDFIPAANVVNVQVIFDYQGSKLENVYNVLSGAGVAVGDLDRIQAKFASWLTTDWKPVAFSGAVCNLMVLISHNVESDIGKEYPIVPGISGLAGGNALPGNVTFTVKWSTGRTGRSYRGRTFHVGLAMGNLDGNQILAAHRPLFQACYAALLTKLAAGGTNDKLVVVSRCQDNVWLPAAVVTPITAAIVEQNLDSQRRRLAGRGV